MFGEQLDFTASGDLLVTMGYGSSKIMKVTTNGEVSEFATMPPGSQNPDLPPGLFGLAIDKAGLVYVGSILSYNIERFSVCGVDPGVFAVDSFNETGGMAFDSAGNLYVADWGSISKYDTSGNRSVFANSGSSALTLTIVPDPVPEASTWAAIGFLGGIGFLTYLRHRQRA